MNSINPEAIHSEAVNAEASSEAMSEAMSLELCIRQALEQGELTPLLEARIQQIVDQGNLTERDWQLLQLLQDAIQDECIRRV